MYQLNYQNKNNNETFKIEARTEEKAIELYKREISINPYGYKIINIINLDQIAEENTYINYKNNYINDTVKEINKIVKSLLKKPYDKLGNIIDNKQIEIKNKNFLNEIKIELEKIYNKNDNNLYMHDEKIYIYIADNLIKIYPTKEYYMQAD